MNYWDRKLLREQLDNKLRQLKTLPEIINLETGWIKLLREVLGMSAAQLGKRVRLDQSRVSRLENAEVNGDLKLSSLKKIAEGLNMRFVYGFVPEKSLESMVENQAKKVASQRMAKINHTMRLEEQEITEEEKTKALRDLIQKILIEEPKNFWDQ